MIFTHLFFYFCLNEYKEKDIHYSIQPKVFKNKLSKLFLKKSFISLRGFLPFVSNKKKSIIFSAVITTSSGIEIVFFKSAK